MEIALLLYHLAPAMKISPLSTKFVQSLVQSLVRQQSVEVLIWPSLSVIISEIYGESVFNYLPFCS